MPSSSPDGLALLDGMINTDDDDDDDKGSSDDISNESEEDDRPNGLSRLLDELLVSELYGAIKAAAGSSSLRAVAGLGPKKLEELAGLPKIKAVKVGISRVSCKPTPWEHEWY